jgi:hypothetical protein
MHFDDRFERVDLARVAEIAGYQSLVPLTFPLAISYKRSAKLGWMDDADLELRRRTYAAFVELGRAPTPAELGDADEVIAGWRRLHEQHALVLNTAADELRMVNPFSAVPTAYRVQADGRWWYANCAWDAFGICAALHVDGVIEASCPDCGESIAIDVRGERPDDESLLFHTPVSAAHWWDDIVFT